MDNRSSILRRTQTRGSLFGAHDNSAVRILRRNETMVGRIHGAIYWYYFRALFPYFSPVLAVIMFIIPLTTTNSLPTFLFSGALLSAVMCALAILSYIQIVPWRKHPSPLIFYRTVVHLVFSVSLIVNAFDRSGASSPSCQTLSFVTQFTFFTGECWLVTIAVDLILSLTNPFTSFKSNVNTYHTAVWVSGIINAVLLANSSRCQGLFAGHICWIDVESPLSGCIWGYYVSWVLLFYSFCIASLFFATYRISRGLERTYATRRACVQETFSVVMAYIFYSAVVCCLYIVIVGKAGTQTRPDYDHGFLKHMRNVIGYCLALRGFVDACLWFRMRDFKGISKFKNISTSNWTQWSSPLISSSQQNVTTANDIGGNRASTVTAGRPSFMSDGRGTRTQADIEGQRVSVEEDFGVDIDLSPQLNMALREEVVHFTTMGIIRAVELAVHPLPGAARSFDIDQKHVFNDFQPNVFQRLRECDGVGEDWYMSQISQPAKERLTEGGSGAFMFFCGSGEFVVKTVKSTEADTLLEILDMYCRHLEENPSSMLVRFYGLHSLTMYNQTFRFVVMRNIFPPAATINQRYDIKGSWVSRSGGVVPPGKKIFCRHCGELFVSGSQTPCPDIVGVHEANFVLKDNDFTSKIRLRPEDAYSTIDILNRDSDALCSMGITDYSLLIGVRNLQYEVDPERVITRRRKSTLCPESVDGSASVLWSAGTRSVNGTPLPADTADDISVSTIPTSRPLLPTILDVSTDHPSAEAQRLAEFSTPARTPGMMTTRESFESEMTHAVVAGGRTKEPHVSGAVRHTDLSAFSHRESSQTTVDNHKQVLSSTDNPKPESPSPPPQMMTRDRDSNLLEISEEEVTGGYLARSVIAPGVYYLGIIDILQKWTLEKKLERLFKVYIMRNSPQGISCMPPEPYRNRFQYKISQIIEHSIFIREITGSWKGKREITDPTPLIDT